jgi:hypothetical protein
MIGQGWIIAFVSALVLWALIWIAKDYIFLLLAWLFGHLVKLLAWMKGY